VTVYSQAMHQAPIEPWDNNALRLNAHQLC